MAPLLKPEDFLAEEQIKSVSENPILTPAQLQQLRQQIDALRRLNVQLRALKYRARTGQEPPLRSELAALAVGGSKRGGGGRGRGRGRGSKHDGEGLAIGGGRGRGRGRGRGSKRGREDEEEDDDSIVVRSSEEEEEEAAAGSSDSEEEQGEEESLQSADSEESEEDFTLPTVTQPRRTGRARRPSKLAKEKDEGGSSSSSSSDEEGEGQAAAAQPEEQQQPQAPAPAGPPEAAEQSKQLAAERGSGSAAAQQQSGKAPSGGSAPEVGQDGGGPKRKALFMLVSEEAADAAGTPLQLPQLKPVVPTRRRKPAEGDEMAEGAEGAAGELGGEEEEEEEAVCGVCGDDEAPEDNVILLCEGKGCSVAVHQLCYGVHSVPEGEWLCDACKAKLKPTAANCCICPVVGGAVKQVTSLGRVVPAAKGKGARSSKGGPYCHLACALWVPEVELSDVPGMSGVRLDKLTAVRVRLRCELCKQAGGAAVQCAFGTCCRSFHVLCGRAAGQQLHFRTTDGEPLAFCALHSKPAFAKLVDELVER